MPIIVEAHYAKRLGLPGYSSHEYALTIRTEVSDAEMVESEGTRWYRLLQDAVDHEIQATGYLPPNQPIGENTNGQGFSSETSDSVANGWLCTGRQRELILTIAEERQMRLAEVELLAQERFGKELRQLTRRQASNIISRLLTA